MALVDAQIIWNKIPFFHFSNWYLCTASHFLHLAPFDQERCKTSRWYQIFALLRCLYFFSPPTNFSSFSFPLFWLLLLHGCDTRKFLQEWSAKLLLYKTNVLMSYCMNVCLTSLIWEFLGVYVLLLLLNKTDTSLILEHESAFSLASNKVLRGMLF